MSRYSTVSLVTGSLCAILAVSAAAPHALAQQSETSQSASDRAQVLAASMSKSKQLVREKRGVRKEKFLDVRSIPAPKADPAAYTGVYEVRDLGLSLTLRVDGDGRVQGTGHEPVDIENAIMRSFTLVDARIQGALLTGTRRYADGAKEKFEGVFINRTSRSSPSDRGTTEFGLGVISKPLRAYGVTFEKLFYQLKR
ncbi:MAG TPA: hypothetical protein VNJ04_04275 [Gemmatimonadaceae bacterium]|nr:hypothetical protein [Gemmatimonadaceae bacterium]